MEKIQAFIENVKFLYAEFHSRRIANKAILIRGTVLDEDIHRGRAAAEDVTNAS